MRINIIPSLLLRDLYWPSRGGHDYGRFKARYGTLVFLALIALSVFGISVFCILTQFSGTIVSYLAFV